jgi:uncharacterized protein YabE (DUF348 family)
LAVRATRLRRLRIQRTIRWTTVGVVVAIILGTLNLIGRKHVILVVDGRTHAVATTSSNVQQFLIGQGIELTSNIRVVPPPTTALADGMTVVVSPAPSMPGVDEPGVGAWVMDRATGALVNPANRAAETSVSAGSAGNTSVVSVRIVVCGKVHDVLTDAGTTGELLSAMGISPDANDRVFPSLKAPLQSGETVRYDRVTVTLRHRWESVPFAVNTTYTDKLAPGVVTVITQGSPGLALVSSRTVRVDGKVVKRHVVKLVYRRAPVAEARLAGPAPSSGGTLTGGARAGIATWYDPPWSGLTAASPWLPFGTHVLVTDLATGRSVVVVINDRGPFAPGKIIDLSPEAFAALSPLSRGVLDVRISW